MFQNNEESAFLPVISFVTLGSKEEELYLVHYISVRDFPSQKNLFH